MSKQYLISEGEIGNFVAEILSGEKPKPLLEGKKPVGVIAEGEVRNNLVGGVTLVNDDKYIFVKDIVSEKLIKYKGKKVKIILEEVK